MNPSEQQFFTDLEKKLWAAADKLRSALDASVYKHVVLGLIFLKYVCDTFCAWQHCEVYADVPGFCCSALLEDIRKHEHVLTPGRYVGAENQEEDGEAFADKMARLTKQLADQFSAIAKLEREIKKNLGGLGYAL